MWPFTNKDDKKKSETIDTFVNKMQDQLRDKYVQKDRQDPEKADYRAAETVRPISEKLHKLGLENVGAVVANTYEFYKRELGENQTKIINNCLLKEYGFMLARVKEDIAQKGKRSPGAPPVIDENYKHPDPAEFSRI
jgi:hypothetical protein